MTTRSDLDHRPRGAEQRDGQGIGSHDNRGRTAFKDPGKLTSPAMPAHGSRRFGKVTKALRHICWTAQFPNATIIRPRVNNVLGAMIAVRSAWVRLIVRTMTADREDREDSKIAKICRSIAS